MDARNIGVGVPDIIPKFGHYCKGVHNTLMNVGNDGLSVHEIVAGVRNDGTCICGITREVLDPLGV